MIRAEPVDAVRRLEPRADIASRGSKGAIRSAKTATSTMASTSAQPIRKDR